MPVSADDIEDLLGRLPGQLLLGLEAICLLGGSNKQAIVDRWWGCYRAAAIYLYPAPRKWLTWRTTRFPRPAQLNRLSPLRPRIRREGPHWLAEVALRELRDFYLYDVLLHEVGHHVEFRRNGCRWRRSRREEERFAEWFAARYAKRLR